MGRVFCAVLPIAGLAFRLVYPGEILRIDHGNVNHLRHYGYGPELEPSGFWGDIAVKVAKEG